MVTCSQHATRAAWQQSAHHDDVPEVARREVLLRGARLHAVAVPGTRQCMLSWVVCSILSLTAPCLRLLGTVEHCATKNRTDTAHQQIMCQAQSAGRSSRTLEATQLVSPVTKMVAIWRRYHIR